MRRIISKKEARFARCIKTDIAQHLVFGSFVFLIVFFIFSIIAWEQGAMGKSSFIEVLNIPRKIDVYIRILSETLLYNLLLAIPVYFNFFLIYKGRFQQVFKIRLINEAQLKGWGFYLFLISSALFAVFFGKILSPVFERFSYIVDPRWGFNALIILLLIMCTSAISFIKDSMERMRQVDRRERRQVRRELNFIKKQIRPHFLFNTLANLQILAKQKSEELPELMAQLSKLLRYLLYQTQEAFVPLEQELDFIKSYIALEKLQLPSNVSLSFVIEGKLASQQVIAPMLLLTFVENCFKHYNKNGKTERFIRVHIHIKDSSLYLRTSNTFKTNVFNEHALDKKEKSGLGLKNVVQSLDIIYKRRYALEVEEEENVFYTTLKVPLNEDSL